MPIRDRSLFIVRDGIAVRTVYGVKLVAAAACHNSLTIKIKHRQIIFDAPQLSENRDGFLACLLLHSDPWSTPAFRFGAGFKDVRGYEA